MSIIYRKGGLNRPGGPYGIWTHLLSCLPDRWPPQAAPQPIWSEKRSRIPVCLPLTLFGLYHTILTTSPASHNGVAECDLWITHTILPELTKCSTFLAILPQYLILLREHRPKLSALTTVRYGVATYNCFSWRSLYALSSSQCFCRAYHGG